MATANTTLAAPKANDRPGLFSWIMTLAACVCIAWIGASLYHSTGEFRNLLVSLNANLPFTTSFVIGNYRWFYPCLFGGAATLVITKQFFVREKRANLGITLAVALAVFIASEGIVRVLYAPLLDTVQKLSK